MDWYYAENGEQKGPVSEQEWGVLVGTGVIKADTLVWREGMTGWQPLAQTNTAAPLQGGLVCSQCGKGFPPEQVIRYGDIWVCGGCKPLFLQRVREGAGSGPTGGMVTEEQLLSRDYRVDVGGCCRAGMEMVHGNIWQMLGVMVLLGIAYMAMNVIPYLNILLVMILGGPLMGGAWHFMLLHVRSRPAGVEDAFKGFGPRFGQLALLNLVWTLATWLCMAPVLLVGLGFGFTAANMRGGTATPAFPAAMVLAFVAAFAVTMIAMLYMMASWFFAYPLVMDKGMRFWPAMGLARRVVGKRFWSTWLLFLVAGLLYMGGFLLCCVGVLWTVPIAFGMLAFHYERVFGDLRPQA